MIRDLTELEKALIAFSEAEKKPSMARQISQMSDTIERVIADGLSLDLVVSFLNQRGINISKNTLKVTLYRLRKKGKESQKVNGATTNKSGKPSPCGTPSPAMPSSAMSVQLKNEKSRVELEKKIAAFSEAIGWEERYVALGGDIEEIRGKPASQKRVMAMELKSKIEMELRFYNV